MKDLASKPADRYLTQAVMTASPETLVVLLYEGALKRLDAAEAAIERRRTADAGRALSRAFDIVAELRAILDLGQGGEVARSLFALYGFVLSRIQAANAQRTPEPLREARAVLSKLKEGWDGLVQSG